MFPVVVAAVVLLWVLGSTVVLALCWAASRGDEREAIAREELLRSRGIVPRERPLVAA